MGSLYIENFNGILYSCEPGNTLLIYADPEEFYLSASDGILNLMSYSGFGRTAVFIKDVLFFKQTQEKIIIQIHSGTASYMKELSNIRPLSDHERKVHEIHKLW